MAKKFVDIIVQAKDKTRAGFKGAEKGLSRLKKSVLSLKGALVGAIGLAAIVRFGKFAVDAAGRQEAAVASLAAALEFAGERSRGAVKDFEKFAAGIQKVTVIGDEVILEMAALGASMAKLTGQELKDATVAAIGLSRVYDLEVVPAMRLVARAAVGDTGSLSRYGIVLDKTLTRQEKFNAVLKIGAAGFVLAKKETETFVGQMGQAGNAFGDLAEQIGDVLKPHILGVTKILREQAEVMEEMSDKEMKELGDRGIRLGKILAGIFVVSRLAETFVALFIKFGVAIGTAAAAVGVLSAAILALPAVWLAQIVGIGLEIEEIGERLKDQMKRREGINRQLTLEREKLKNAVSSEERLNALTALREFNLKKMGMFRRRLNSGDFAGETGGRNMVIIITGLRERIKVLNQQVRLEQNIVDLQKEQAAAKPSEAEIKAARAVAQEKQGLLFEIERIRVKAIIEGDQQRIRLLQLQHHREIQLAFQKEKSLAVIDLIRTKHAAETEALLLVIFEERVAKRAEAEKERGQKLRDIADAELEITREIARLKVDIAKEGIEREMELLKLRAKIEIEEATKAGISIALIREKQILEEAMLRKRLADDAPAAAGGGGRAGRPTAGTLETRLLQSPGQFARNELLVEARRANRRSQRDRIRLNALATAQLDKMREIAVALKLNQVAVVGLN